MLEVPHFMQSGIYASQTMYLPIHTGNTLAAGGVMTTVPPISSVNGMLTTYYTPLNTASSNFCAPGSFGSLSNMSIPNYLAGEGPAQLRKLFIGGLNHETTDEQLQEYYSQWGTVVDCIVIRDPATKHSRGFGFVTYSTILMAENAMTGRPHTINGKVVDPKRAIPREQMLPMTANNPPYFLECEPEYGCKLTLSGIHWDFHTVDDLRQYFIKYGEVEQVEIVGQPRGYGFVVFQQKSSADKCLADNQVHIINARKIDVKEFSETNTLAGSSSFIIPSRKNRLNISANNHNSNWQNSHYYHNQRHQSSSVASQESTNCTPESSTHSDDQMESSAKRLSLQQFLTDNNLSDEVNQFQDDFSRLSTISFDLKDLALPIIKNNNVINDSSSTNNNCLNN